MKKWLGWVREHWSDWPIFVSIVIGFLNTEVATPFIFKGILDLSGGALGAAAGTWATAELSWWFYFSGWLYNNKIRKLASIKEAINLGQEAKEFDFRKFLLPKIGDPYFIVKIKNFIRNHSIDNFDYDKYQNDHFFNNLVNTLKVFGYILTCGLVFIMGLLPLWWIFALMVCRLLKWRLASAALFTGNFLKNYYLALIYERVGFWWWITLFFASVLIMSYVFKMIVKNVKQVSKDH